MRRGEAGDDYERRLDRIRHVVGEERFALGVQLVEARARSARDRRRRCRAWPRRRSTSRGGRGERGVRARSHGRIAGERARRARTRPARRRRADPCLGSRPDLPVHRRDRRANRTARARSPPRSISTAWRQRVTAALSACRPRRARSTRSTRGCGRKATQGPLAVSLDSFARYQREDAWTWEHMALTPRAAAVRLARGARRARSGSSQTCSTRRAIRPSCAPTCWRCAPRWPRTSRRAGPLDAKLLRGGLVDLRVHRPLPAAARADRRSTRVSAKRSTQLVDAGLLPDRVRARTTTLMARLLVAARLLAPDGEHAARAPRGPCSRKACRVRRLRRAACKRWPKRAQASRRPGPSCSAKTWRSTHERPARRRRPAARHRPRNARRRQRAAVRLPRPQAGAVLLSQGRHARLHDREQGLLRAAPRVREGRHRAARGEQGPADEAREVRRQARPDRAAGDRCRDRAACPTRSASGPRRASTAAPYMGMQRTTYLVDADGRDRARLAQGEGQGPRRRSARGRQGADFERDERRRGDPRRAADRRAARQGHGHARRSRATGDSGGWPSPSTSRCPIGPPGPPRSSCCRPTRHAQARQGRLGARARSRCGIRSRTSSSSRSTSRSTWPGGSARTMGPRFVGDFLAVAADEAMHFALLDRRLRALGIALWRAAGARRVVGGGARHAARRRGAARGRADGARSARARRHAATRSSAFAPRATGAARGFSNESLTTKSAMCVRHNALHRERCQSARRDAARICGKTLVETPLPGSVKAAIQQLSASRSRSAARILRRYCVVNVLPGQTPINETGGGFRPSQKKCRGSSAARSRARQAVGSPCQDKIRTGIQVACILSSRTVPLRGSCHRSPARSRQAPGSANDNCHRHRRSRGAIDAAQAAPGSGDARIHRSSSPAGSSRRPRR